MNRLWFLLTVLLVGCVGSVRPGPCALHGALPAASYNVQISGHYFGRPVSLNAVYEVTAEGAVTVGFNDLGVRIFTVQESGGSLKVDRRIRLGLPYPPDVLHRALSYGITLRYADNPTRNFKQCEETYDLVANPWPRLEVRQGESVLARVDLAETNRGVTAFYSDRHGMLSMSFGNKRP